MIPAFARAQDSVTAVAGPQYAAGWLTRLVFGSDYRELWVAQNTVPSLDLATYAGGLTPFRTGGFGQTNSLHFYDPDSLRYVFRSVDKDPSRRLAEELRGTLVEDAIRDQISALFPGAALVVAPLLHASGVLTPQPNLFVMPDTPLLGEFRDQFAGMLGLLMENPDEGPDDAQGEPEPGFAGSRRVSDTQRLFDEIEDSPDDRADALQYLKARLLDVFVGDRDRHRGQWRWARFPRNEHDVWVPVPEDRDQAFIDQDGMVMWIVRTFLARKYVTFGREYPPIEDVTWNGWDIDRRLLSAFDRATWDSVALDLRNRITDSVIQTAVKQLPQSYYALRGEWLIDVLRSRRDGLTDMADRFYRMLANTVSVHATDVSEFAQIRAFGDRYVRVEISDRRGDSPREPHFTRIFDARETSEIRVDLHGGDDRAVVSGARVPIQIRVIGGGGADTLIDSTATRVHFYDSGDKSHFVRGDRTSVDRRDFDAPPSSDPAHEHPPDWGHWLRVLPFISARADFGLLVGMQLTDERYGFRKFPFSTRWSVRGNYATGAGLPSVEARWEWREFRPKFDADVRIQYSGLDLIRFFGFGNETENPDGGDFFRVRHLKTGFATTVAYGRSAPWRIYAGLELQQSRTEEDQNTLLGTTRPYGGGTFNHAGVRAGINIDLTDRRAVPTHGVRIGASGLMVPGILDARASYARLEAEAIGYVTMGPTVAVRVHGSRTIGEVPFHHSAYVGGYGTLRGFTEQRFAGDAAFVANGELRIPLGSLNWIVPMRVGAVGFGDVGRVFVDGERSDRWHRGGGGGLWVSVLNPSNTMAVMAARGERTAMYVTAGLMF